MPTQSSNIPGSTVDDLYGDLIEDLESVAGLVLAKAALRAPASESIALVRVINGMSVDDWECYSSTYSPDDWLVLPLSCGQSEAVAKLLEVQKNLIFQRDHDALTGIGNKGYFHRRLDIEVRRALRSHTELTLIYADLDDFKKVNDTWGHACGDMVLQYFAQLLQNSVRHYDITARLGGEEFAAILPVTSAWTGVMLGNRILDSFSKKVFTFNGEEFSMTFSGGVSSLALLDGDAKTCSGLLESADKAMYEAKKNNKNNICIAQSAKLKKERISLVQANEKQLLFSHMDPE
ncbi:MAG: GGDEF domain-containing protein [Desulfovibrio sp.]|jgi:diguanylate cyclase (GGDEF)-like protein|nr:GGDEF domain-containing protein [Desulfovibrio sp.]